ncbi:MAG TPA: DUF5750 family protein [Methanobacterium sp.]|nr:DUF5750 family protein [Methanobacterium sp.]
MKVQVTEYGRSVNSKYFVTYRVFDIDKTTLNKLKERIEDEIEIKSGELFLTVYFDEGYFPFGSDESKFRTQDFIDREEIEMIAYLLGILED